MQYDIIINSHIQSFSINFFNNLTSDSFEFNFFKLTNNNSSKQKKEKCNILILLNLICYSYDFFGCN